MYWRLLAITRFEARQPCAPGRARAVPRRPPLRGAWSRSRCRRHPRWWPRVAARLVEPPGMTGPQVTNDCPLTEEAHPPVAAPLASTNSEPQLPLSEPASLAAQVPAKDEGAAPMAGLQACHEHRRHPGEHELVAAGGVVVEAGRGQSAEAQTAAVVLAAGGWSSLPSPPQEACASRATAAAPLRPGISVQGMVVNTSPGSAWVARRQAPPPHPGFIQSACRSWRPGRSGAARNSSPAAHRR